MREFKNLSSLYLISRVNLVSGTYPGVPYIGVYLVSSVPYIECLFVHFSFKPTKTLQGVPYIELYLVSGVPYIERRLYTCCSHT